MRINIEKFQELNSIQQVELEDLEKSVLLVKCFTGYLDDKINKMSTKKFNNLCRKVNVSFNKMSININEEKPKNVIRANGRWYWLNYDIAKTPMNAGRYVEVSTFTEDIVGNLHKIMATMATPMKWSWKGLVLDKSYKYDNHEAISNDMLKADFSVAYHSAVFFWAVFSKSIVSSQNYFLSIAEDKTKMAQTIQNFKEASDGFSMLKWYRNLREFA